MGFVKPGQSTPWLTNTIELREDEQWAVQEIVTRQAFADGQTYTYGSAILLEAGERAGDWEFEEAHYSGH